MDSMKAPELKRIGRLSGWNVPYRSSSRAPWSSATCKCTHSCTSIPPPPFQIESWRQLASRGRMAVPWPTRSSRPAIRDRISTLELFYTFSLPAQASSSCLLSLRVNTSLPEQFFPSSAWKYGEVGGMVCKADLEPVQLGGNQLYQDEFLCPEALAGPVVGHRTGLLVLRPKVSPAEAVRCYQGFNRKSRI